MRAIAFYLPQYHPVPENDEWWGRGFTEWRNVVKARPLFPGHYQPHLPADLGFYDLRLPEVREAQAELAQQYGIHGFCYYHYWFNGRHILERPFNEVLESGKPDLPFCLCWANENWTRVWDGGEKNVLLEQKYNHEDDLAHIESLIPAFQDSRYIRVNGRPLFLVYRTELMPDPKRTAEIWREACIKAGVGNIYLVRVENFVAGIDPVSIGFDAAVEFAPDGRNMGKQKFREGLPGMLSRWGVIPRAFVENKVVNYGALATGTMGRPEPGFKRFRCVTPMWDNSARRKKGARIVIGSTPALYEKWLKTIVVKTQSQMKGDERLVFINAWNEWAEGNHLEPDLKWGRGYLEATRRALASAQDVRVPAASPTLPPPSARAESGLRRAFWKLRAYLGSQLDLIRHIFWRCP
ncbi:MAG: glycoside hydrolase family 99-like domain-containing protein [Thiobacillus sp.]|nr:glycoside hydrolase family 99-like domain-containing protein [Thiobacillus sp.]